MQDLFIQSQWDTLLAYLKQGDPPLWMLLAAVNGSFLVWWGYLKVAKQRPMRPASINAMRGVLLLLNLACIFRDDTLRLVRPFIRYFI